MKLPIIVSSAKPFDGGDYDNLQRKAILSWKDVAERRLMFNEPEEIECLGDLFHSPSSNPPTIREILDVSITQVEPHLPIAVVNSDIILTPEITRVMEVAKNLGMAWAATSFRWERDGERDLGVIGQGLDIFILTPQVLIHVLRDIPQFMTIGRGLWDSWLCGWLRRNMQDGRFFDITPWRCVIHNLHDRPPGRLSNYTEEQVNQIARSGHLSCSGLPLTSY